MHLNTAGRSFAKRSGKKYENPENTLRLEKDKNNAGVRVDWPYPHADRDSIKRWVCQALLDILKGIAVC